MKYIVLGITQGLTEFLPVSSSGHLVILQKLMGLGGSELALTVILHLATALSLVVFFFKDILRLFKNVRLLLMIVLVTLATGIIGLSGKDFFEGLFSSVRPVAAALVVTGIILLLTKGFFNGKRKDVNFKDALILGITQGIAIVPGISRSGITVSTLLFRGLDKETSFQFSFLAAIPVILGASLLELKEIDFALNANPSSIAAGFIASFLTGLLALWGLRAILRKARLHYFGFYCIAAGLAVLLFMR